MLSDAQRPRRKQRAPKLSDAQRQAKYTRKAEVRKHRAELARMEAGVAAERDGVRYFRPDDLPPPSGENHPAVKFKAAAHHRGAARRHRLRSSLDTASLDFHGTTFG